METTIDEEIQSNALVTDTCTFRRLLWMEGRRERPCIVPIPTVEELRGVHACQSPRMVAKSCVEAFLAHYQSAFVLVLIPSTFHNQ